MRCSCWYKGPYILKIAIFSGTFDPIHKGHIELARKALRLVGKVMFVAEPTSWSKVDVTSIEHRENMIKLAIKDIDGLDFLSNKSNKPHTTKRVLESLSSVLDGRYEVSFLMGADTFRTIGNWDDLRNCRGHSFIVAERDKEDALSVSKLSSELDLRVQEIESVGDISSSQIRQGNLLNTTKAVESYILKNNLYNIL